MCSIIVSVDLKMHSQTEGRLIGQKHTRFFRRTQVQFSCIRWITTPAAQLWAFLASSGLYTPVLRQTHIHIVKNRSFKKPNKCIRKCPSGPSDPLLRQRCFPQSDQPHPLSPHRVSDAQLSRVPATKLGFVSFCFPLPLLFCQPLKWLEFPVYNLPRRYVSMPFYGRVW